MSRLLYRTVVADVALYLLRLAYINFYRMYMPRSNVNICCQFRLHEVFAIATHSEGVVRVQITFTQVGFPILHAAIGVPWLWVEVG